ncbi:hypothetical protein B0J13DRAFT_572243 [Dactylonectria estremocensis]|uniref:Uncharacterized protein n=1 Tax=Dactylonectria estremocensis TaxID=1079267 RepID=A0A9P9D9Z3_9HYPO|nr:hypothetical protein B0J13DRAFT_572243 [Dactylonectria estremocensis]
MNAIRLLPVLYFAAYGSALGGASELCTWEPMLPVKAGSDISMKIQNPWGDKCRAELELSDDKFPKWQFKAPLGAPNGDANLTWQCDGDVPMSCIYITETARCVPSTMLLTYTASRGGEKPTGVFLETRSFNPTAATALSIPASEALDSATTTPVATDVSAPTTLTKSWVNTPSFNSLVGAGGTRKAGETSAQLPIDTSTSATSTTNTTSVTTTTADLVTTPIGGSITTTTTTTTTEDGSANEPSYVTITATIATCPAMMREHA